MAITFNPANMTTAEGKAREYNRLRQEGYSDAAIRQAAGTQSDGDWSYLQGLAQRQQLSPAQLASFQALSPEQKAQTYLGSIAGGQTDEQARMRASGLFGMQSDSDWKALQGFAQNLTPAQKAQVYNSARASGLTDAQIRDGINRGMGQQSDGDWAYLQGAAQRQMANPAQLANFQAMTPQSKAQVYLEGLASGQTDEQIRMRASGLFGTQTDENWNALKGIAQNLTPQQKAQVYNQARAAGLSDAQIRANINQSLGQQTDSDWAALQNLAGQQPGAGGAANGGAANGGVSGGAAASGAQGNPFMPQTLSNPFTYTPNPYLSEMANTIRQQVTDNLQRNILPGIGSAAIAAGGYGGSRQGVVEANALKDANTGLSGALSNLYGQDYTNAMSRNLQKYQADQGYNLGVGNLGLGFQNSAQQYALGLGGLANQRYGQDQNFALGLGGLANQRYGQDQNFVLGAGNLGVNAYQAQTARDLGQGNLGLGYYNAANNFALGAGGLANQRYGQDQNFALGMGNLGLGYQNSLQNFYTAQRGQDMQGVQLGANLVQQGNTGMQQQGQGLYNLGLTQQQAPWNVVGNYTNTVSPFTGFGNTTNSTPGNAGAGALGGALIGAQLYNIFNKP